MDQGTISRRYASALWMYATKNGAQERVYAQTKQLYNGFAQYPSLKRVLSNRMLTHRQKAEVVAMVAGAKTGGLFQNFVRLVLVNKREPFLPSICLSFETIYLRENKIIKANLVTAVPVDKEMQRRFIQKLEARTGHTIALENRVDPQIVGGYMVTLDSWRLDASVTGQLKRIKAHLVEKAFKS